MEAKELRIGNWVNYRFNRNDEEDYDEWGHWIQVSADDISMVADGSIHYREIPITEEWLKRFGFEHSPEAMNYNLWVGNGIVGEFIGGLFQIQASGLPQCNQVHQLQNQFNVLKNGEELELK